MRYIVCDLYDLVIEDINHKFFVNLKFLVDMLICFKC